MTSVAVRSIGDVQIAVVDRDDAVSLVADAVNGRRGWLIGFANAHTVNMARRMPAFARALRNGLIFNDGVGVDLASRVLHGESFPDNLNGTDLTPAILETLPPGTRLFLVGSPPGVAEDAARALRERHPHLAIAGVQHGFFEAAEEPALLQRISAADPHLILAGMGHPRQELWAADHVRRLGVPVLCIGALLDFYSGHARRAPSWVRSLRAEWAYRLWREPRRLARRYLIGNAAFLAYLVHCWVRKRALPADGRLNLRDLG